MPEIKLSHADCETLQRQIDSVAARDIAEYFELQEMGQLYSMLEGLEVKGVPLAGPGAVPHRPGAERVPGWFDEDALAQAIVQSSVPWRRAAAERSAYAGK